MDEITHLSLRLKRAELWANDLAARRSAANLAIHDALELRLLKETDGDRLRRIARAVRLALAGLYPDDPPPVCKDENGRWVWEQECHRCHSRYTSADCMFCPSCRNMTEQWRLSMPEDVTGMSYPTMDVVETLEFAIPKNAPKARKRLAELFRWMADQLQASAT